MKTQLYLLVATYTEGMCPSICVEATEKLGKFVSHCMSSFPMVESFDCKWQRPNSDQLGFKGGVDWKDTGVTRITTGRMESSWAPGKRGSRTRTLLELFCGLLLRRPGLFCPIVNCVLSWLVSWPSLAFYLFISFRTLIWQVLDHMVYLYIIHLHGGREKVATG